MVTPRSMPAGPAEKVAGSRRSPVRGRAQDKNNRLRVGLIGLGAMGNVHVAALARNADFDLVAWNDVHPDGRTVGAEFWANPLELLAGASPDLVVIATPPATHPPLAEAALDAGVHVLCEKPLAPDHMAAAGMAEAAQESTYVAAVNLQLRFSLGRMELRRRVLSGSVGRLLSIAAQVTAPGFHQVAPAWYRRRDLGGGALMEFGTHMLDQMIWIGGPITSATSVAGPVKNGSASHGSTLAADDHLAALFRFEGGHFGQLTVSSMSRSTPRRVFEVVGDEATLRLIGDDELYFETSNGHSGRIELPAETFGSLIADPHDTYTQPLQRLYSHLGDALLRGGPTPPLATFADAAMVQAIVDAARSGVGEFASVGRNGEAPV